MTRLANCVLPVLMCLQASLAEKEVAQAQRLACLSDEEALCLSRLSRHELWDLGQLVGGELEQLVTEPSGWGLGRGGGRCAPY